MKISIIIPVYNTAHFLQKCLDSCIHQDLSPDEYEIIVINDGSTDDSATICKGYRARFEHVIYIEQANAGLSVVRNNGLAIAKGEYVWFVDSDDWVRENCLASVYAQCKNHSLDVLWLGFAKVDESFTETVGALKQSEKLPVYTGKEVLKGAFVFGVPLHIFRRDFLLNNNLSFYPKIYHEDNEFTPRALYLAQRIAVTQEVYYYYYTRDESISTTVNPKNCYDLLIVCRSLMKFTNSVDPDLKPYINDIISTSYNSFLNYAGRLGKSFQDDLQIKIVENKDIFMHMKQSQAFKYRLEGIVFSLFPHLVLGLYTRLKKYI